MCLSLGAHTHISRLTFRKRDEMGLFSNRWLLAEEEEDDEISKVPYTRLTRTIWLSQIFA